MNSVNLWLTCGGNNEKIKKPKKKERGRITPVNTTEAFRSCSTKPLRLVDLFHNEGGHLGRLTPPQSPTTRRPPSPSPPPPTIITTTKPHLRIDNTGGTRRRDESEPTSTSSILEMATTHRSALRMRSFARSTSVPTCSALTCVDQTV